MTREQAWQETQRRAGDPIHPVTFDAKRKIDRLRQYERFFFDAGYDAGSALAAQLAAALDEVYRKSRAHRVDPEHYVLLPRDTFNVAHDALQQYREATQQADTPQRAP